MHSIKVFACGADPRSAGDDLTNQFEHWKADKFGGSKGELAIASTSTTSNNYGWMITILYKRVLP